VSGQTLPDVTHELAALTKMRTGELIDRYQQVFGAPPRTRNAAWMRKRIAFRLQEAAEGGLSDRARLRIADLGDELPLAWRERLGRAAIAAERAGAASRPVTTSAPPPAPTRDPRLPPIGTVLRRVHAGVEHQCVVLDGGFEYRGRVFKSLSQVAKHITGTDWNGLLFFGLKRRGRRKERVA